MTSTSAWAIFSCCVCEEHVAVILGSFTLSGSSFSCFSHSRAPASYVSATESSQTHENAWTEPLASGKRFSFRGLARIGASRVHQGCHMYQADLKAIALGTGRRMAPGRATGRWSSTTSYRIDGHSGSTAYYVTAAVQAVAVKLTHARQEQGSTQLIDADKLEPTNTMRQSFPSFHFHHCS